ncbi:unnamed protein product [Sphagnum troendelagicum]|uniref:Uncharacterized protein n=1 Tax=Sphagnum jensenii TaxID=128206 RepID=A0ABP0WLH7_9BRYO
MADDEVRGGHNDSRREKQAPGNDVWSLSSQSASLQKLRFRLAAMHLQHRFLRLERNRVRRRSRSGGRKDFLENRCCELEAIAQR